MIRRLRLVLLLAGLALVVGSAFTAVNVVASSRASSTTDAVTAAQLAPPQCAGLPLTVIYVVGGGTIGSGSSQLILGTPGRDVINARGNRDCLLGGGGDDILIGGGGRDVCIGGPGNDVFLRCETRYP